MMVEVSRRWFVFGTAAAVTAAAVPSGAFPDQVVRAPALEPFIHRKVREIMMGFEETGAEDQFARVAFWVGDRAVPFYRVQINTRGYLRWRAMPGDEQVILPTETLRIEAEFIRHETPVRVDLICSDTVDEAEPIHMVEEHHFDGGKWTVVGPHFLEPDNSFEARTRRKQEREARDAEYCRALAAGEIVQRDYDDEIEEDGDGDFDQG